MLYLIWMSPPRPGRPDRHCRRAADQVRRAAAVRAEGRAAVADGPHAAETPGHPAAVRPQGCAAASFATVILDPKLWHPAG